MRSEAAAQVIDFWQAADDPLQPVGRARKNQSKAVKNINEIRASFLSSLAIVPIWILYSFYENGWFYFSSVGGLLIGLYILAFGVVIAFGATILIGVPLDVFLRKKGLTSPSYYAVVGALVPPLLVLLLGGYDQDDRVGAVINYVGFGVTGLVVALTFWYFRNRTNTGK